MAELLMSGDEPMLDDGRARFRLRDWVDTAPFEDLLGMCIETVSGGRAELSMEFVLKLSQGGGLLHGGALTALADTAVALAIKSLLREGTRFATTDMSMRFLAPVTQGRIKALAEVDRPQGRTFLGRARLIDDTGKEVAVFSAVFRVARGQGFEDESQGV